MGEKIQLLNPDTAKKGAVIGLEKYETVKQAILTVLQEHRMVTFKELMEEIPPVSSS